MMRLFIFTAALSLIMFTMLAAEAPSKPQTHTVTIEGMRFQPEVLNVAPGRHDRVGQQGPGSSHGDVQDRQLRFEGNSGRQVLEAHDSQNG